MEKQNWPQAVVRDIPVGCVRKAVHKFWLSIVEVAVANKGRAAFVKADDLKQWTRETAATSVLRAGRRHGIFVRTRYTDDGLYVWFDKKRRNR